ncbi:MAG TPA: FAD-binding oxidoreductase [Solirubrobacteraceae bacterium]|nr:FAD-binding oxidoreductase [Solirubrobacteraceae bacterium]
MRPCEVAVVGAGIVGAAIAAELHRRGVDVALLDRGEVSAATTGLGEGNVLCSDKEAGPELDLTIAGLRVYDEIEERFGDEARIRRKGALIVHRDPAGWAGEPARLERLGIDSRLLAADEVRAMEPELTGAIEGASYFPRDLQCAPRAIARALARELPRVHTGLDVHEVELRSARVAGLRTSEGELPCGAAVIAAGPWSRALAEAAGAALPLEPRKGQLVRLRADGRDDRFIRHKVVEAGYLASVASGEASLQVTTVLETTFEGDVLVGSSRERRGFDLTVDEGVSHAMLDRAAALMPGLRGLPIDAAWAGLRPWLPDQLPAIGPVSAVEGLWLATGHEGAGVALGPVTGRLVAQLYAGEPPVVDPAPFAPDRFAM